MQIININFEDIKQFWESKLWPGRENIEDRSAMLHLTGHDMKNFELQVFYLGLEIDEKIIGVNSGHICGDGSFRSRGLWIDYEYRGLGLGVYLLESTIDVGKINNSTFCWSFPRKSSWSTYKKAGFYLTSEWSESETSSANAFCKYDYN